MTGTTLYGIKNCDTVKKARRWLEDHKINYRFVDFRADGIDAVQVENWIATIGLDNLINKRSTTWKNLTDDERAAAENPLHATALLLAQPTLIKRPLLETASGQLTGFKAPVYADIFTH